MIIFKLDGVKDETKAVTEGSRGYNSIAHPLNPLKEYLGLLKPFQESLWLLFSVQENNLLN